MLLVEFLFKKKKVNVLIGSLIGHRIKRNYSQVSATKAWLSRG